MLIKRLVSHYCAPRLAALGLLAIYPIPSQSTAVAVIIGKSGMVIATDSKGMTSGVVEGQTERIGERKLVKAFIIQHRFATVCIGYCTYNFSRNGEPPEVIDYDFGTWILNIERGLPDKISFDAFVDTVNNELGKIIPKLRAPIAAGAMQPKNAWDKFEVVSQYVITGYESGTPRLSVLEFYVDWEAKRLQGPYQVPVEPNGPLLGKNRGYMFGVKEAATEFLNRNSYAYKQATVLCPKAFDNFITNRAISLNESTSLAKVLVRIEENTNPSWVGGGVQAVTILPTGRADVLREEDLPKTRTGQKKQTPK